MTKDKIKGIEQKYDMWADDFNLDSQDVEWLIEQAQRVLELEGKHKEYVSFVESNNHSMDADLEKLYKQNKRYRDALIYVTKSHIEQYHDFENMLEDIKFVVNKTLEGKE